MEHSMSYNQNIASTTQYGVVKVGTGLAATDGVISAATGLALNYGFASSVTNQTNPVPNAINTVTFDTLGPANGVAIGGAGDTLVVTNPGIYTKLFTLTTTKTSGGTSTLSIWLRRNGVDLVGSSQELQLTNTLSTVFVSGNYTLSLAAGDNISMHWSSPDITAGMAVLPPLTGPIRPSGYAIKVTLTRIS
jgi:hypothetical protein